MPFQSTLPLFDFMCCYVTLLLGKGYLTSHNFVVIAPSNTTEKWRHQSGRKEGKLLSKKIGEKKEREKHLKFRSQH